ncbi:cytochrome c peroxidase [Thiogranum longum]|uniref:Cytochrome c peroxidase n=1 Tax=Thiogranum longum TaxID=1537524 RepID=A0A4R1HDD1_9GAMM|nr:cytochrome c peroxidase [Thiogranum longum]TCK18701.1 cytochrome c peroxidase [Thiogranum longum]
MKVLSLILIATITIANPVYAANQTREQKLGKLLFQDINLSFNRNQSCMSCHALDSIDVPVAQHHTDDDSSVTMALKPITPGFVDAANVLDGTSVSNGSLVRKFGSLNAPSVGYAAFSPVFFRDSEEELFFGGQFWNGRAADLVEQAKAPLLNPVEMAMPNEWSVIERLKENRKYRKLFKQRYNIDLAGLNEDSPGVANAYQAMAEAIAAFERSREFNRFDSKFDFEAAGITSYNDSEQRGADLFDGRALCGLCHTTEGIEGDGTPALLTDFSYDNLGVPANPQIPGNPDADPGLRANPNLEAARGEPSPLSETEGRQKVMSLRNIALTAPYMHNGVFKTLEEVVHFYNTRDVLDRCIDPADATHPGFGVTCWPEGEFHATRNITELGNLGLSPEDEADIVAYLKTFTDNYPRWGNSSGLRDRNVSKKAKSPFADFPVPVHSIGNQAPSRLGQ